MFDCDGGGQREEHAAVCMTSLQVPVMASLLQIIKVFHFGFIFIKLIRNRKTWTSAGSHKSLTEEVSKTFFRATRLLDGRQLF